MHKPPDRGLFALEKDRFMNNKKLFLTIGGAILLLTFLMLVVFYADPYFLRNRQTAESYLTAENVVGDVSITHLGNNYILKNGIEIYTNDTILVGRNAECELVANGRLRSTLSKDSQVRIREREDQELAVEVLEGAALFDLIQTTPEKTNLLLTQYAQLAPETGAVLSIEAYTGTQTVNLYAGTASLRYDGKTYTLHTGDHVTMFQSEDELFITNTEILASELRDFLLIELLDRDGLCFDAASLQQIISSRKTDVETIAPDSNAERMTCTVEIRCDTVLTQEKKHSYAAPSDGVILPPTPVKFTQGETAYEVLRRVCKAAGIDVTYNYMPLIGGYYVTGIDGLEEHDFGPGSGWLFEVNGWFPNFGSGKYEISDSDFVVWHYSCEGGGTDLGREEWVERPIGE